MLEELPASEFHVLTPAAHHALSVFGQSGLVHVPDAAVRGAAECTASLCVAAGGAATLPCHALSVSSPACL